jgi:hypothetical protein
MTTPVAHCPQEIVNRFLLRPEIAREFPRVAGKPHTLLHHQLFDTRMNRSDVFIRNRYYNPSFALLQAITLNL